MPPSPYSQPSLHGQQVPPQLDHVQLPVQMAEGASYVSQQRGQLVLGGANLAASEEATPLSIGPTAPATANVGALRRWCTGILLGRIHCSFA